MTAYEIAFRLAFVAVSIYLALVWGSRIRGRR